MKKHPRHTSQNKSNTCTIEALEDRQLLSAAFIEAGGRLVVRGTSGNDKITISRNPSNSSQLHVLVNAQSFDFTSKYVTQVRVEAGSGNDLVQSDTSKGAVDAPMFFLGDSGNDTLLTSSADDCLIGGGDADVLVAKAGSNYVNGGAGNDRIFAGSGNDSLVGETGTVYFSDAGGRNSLPDHVSGETVVS
jgi:Ca2+-binding RTX toxin-like protein